MVVLTLKQLLFLLPKKFKWINSCCLRTHCVKLWDFPSTSSILLQVRHCVYFGIDSRVVGKRKSSDGRLLFYFFRIIFIELLFYEAY